MKKDFDSWNKLKKDIDLKTGAFYHEREIWWCVLGLNIGSEQDGSVPNYYRPVLVLKALSKDTCLILPLTKSSKDHKFRLSIGSIDNEDAHVVLSQLRVVDKKRFVRKICSLDKDVFEKVRKSVKDML